MTATIGDTSDRASGRPRKTAAETETAARSYAEQCFTILDRAKTQVVANGDWLKKLSLPEVLDLAANFTVQQFLARRFREFPGHEVVARADLLAPRRAQRALSC